MSSCIFCRIAAGEIPAAVVKRGDGMLAFKDLNPQAPSHVLVIPTTHVGTLNDAKDSMLLGKLMAEPAGGIPVVIVPVRDERPLRRTTGLVAFRADSRRRIEPDVPHIGTSGHQVADWVACD